MTADLSTTAEAGSSVLELQAQWATADTADTANILAVEIATIERVM